MRVKLVKAQYGEKQAPLLWYRKMDSIMTKMGFVRCPMAPCLYARITDDEYTICSVHVDDGILATDKPDVVEEFIANMQKEVRQVTYSPQFQKYTGMDIKYDRENCKIYLGMKTKIQDLKGTGKSEKIPMTANANLRTAAPNPANSSLLPVTGQVRYIVDHGQWNCLCPVGEVSSGGAQQPSDLHVATARKMVDYLKSTDNRTLALGGAGPLELFAFADASYITAGKAKSRLGGALFAGYDSGAVYAFSKTAKNIAQSSTHAEVIAADLVARLFEYSRQVCKFLNIPMTTPTRIFVDNKSSIQLCER